MSYSQTPERLAYETRNKEVTTSKLREALTKTLWTRLDSGLVSLKQKVNCQCQCGKVREVRVRELIVGQSMCCRSCSTRLRMAKTPYAVRVQHAKKASVAAAEALAKREDPLVLQYGEGAVSTVLHTLSSAKQRCNNPNCNQYGDYGLRGIKFLFPSVRAGGEWVLTNIGPRPEGRYSLDRIDNNRHYEAGNLRWATYSDQARNKRVYTRTKNGERIRTLQAQRPDLTYETIRLWIKQGASDEDILGRVKYDRSSL